MAPQVEVVRGDLTVPETLDRCLQDIDAVFVVWVAPATAAASVLERIAKHARRIVFLTAPLKTPHPFFQQPNPSRDAAERIERLIETSGLEWTFLRAGIVNYLSSRADVDRMLEVLRRRSEGVLEQLDT